jgi:hypothetical protein
MYWPEKFSAEASENGDAPADAGAEPKTAAGYAVERGQKAPQGNCRLRQYHDVHFVGRGKLGYHIRNRFPINIPK